MSTDVMGNFSCLDELVQVIYQSVYRFVVLSSVSDKWYVHLGLSGPEGRWWRGSCNKSDILQIIGAKASDKLLETFAEKLAETIAQGELQIGDWSSEKGAKINLTFGPTSKQPMHMSLEELSPEEAASHATNVLLEIALQAQSRKCRLHPDPYATSSFNPNFDMRSERPVVAKPKGVPSPCVDENKDTSATEHKREGGEGSVSKSVARGPVTVQKPMARVHPAKKARKYEAIEFESDDD